MTTSIPLRIYLNISTSENGGELMGEQAKYFKEKLHKIISAAKSILRYVSVFSANPPNMQPELIG